jgi:methyl-accepting chemotaxis protein
MGSFRNMKISAKLLSGFFAVLALTVALGVVSLLKLAALNENANQLGDNWVVALYALGQIDASILQVRRFELSYYSADKPELKAQIEQELATRQDVVKKAMAEYEPTLTLDLEKRLYPEFKDSYEKVLSDHALVVSILKDHKSKEAEIIINGTAKSEFNKADEIANQLFDANYKAAQDEAKVAHATYASARLTTLLVLGTAIAAGLVLAFWIASGISRPLREAAEVMREAEQQRNLTVHLKADTEDEVGQICTSFNGFVKTLHDVITQIAGTADHVASASEEISSSAEQQAQSAATQKDQTTQVATALQEMNVTVSRFRKTPGKRRRLRAKPQKPRAKADQSWIKPWPRCR